MITLKKKFGQKKNMDFQLLVSHKNFVIERSHLFCRLEKRFEVDFEGTKCVVDLERYHVGFIMVLIWILEGPFVM
jgi:hypothetical protein